MHLFWGVYETSFDDYLVEGFRRDLGIGWVIGLDNLRGPFIPKIL